VSDLAQQRQLLDSIEAQVATWKPQQIPVSPEVSPAQPDQNGEFATPLDGALWMAATFGIPQTPLKGKAPFLPSWPEKASADPVRIRAWAAEYPGCNFGSVATPGRHFIFEADKPPDGVKTVRERFKDQGHDFTAQLVIESSQGGHRYYLSAPGVDNLAQNAVKHSDFSVRVDGEQCVSPGGVHPVTGKKYRVAVHKGPLAPPTAEEILFWKSERAEKKTANPVGIEEAIPTGQRNSTITSILGRARQIVGADYETLLALARQHNQRCSPPLPLSELETISRSVARYDVKPVSMLKFDTSTDSGQTADLSEWRSQFRNLSEMEQGEPIMIIDGVLQEGICFLGASPGHGKTLIGLAYAKATCLGLPLFGIAEYAVKQPRNVIYLIPESGDRAFRKRGEAFRLPQDDDRFLARTISAGVPLTLDNPLLIEAVRLQKPVVILDTASRFLQANDENSAAQNRLLVNDVIALRAAGAVCVIILHHAKKSQSERREAMTLDNMLRGTSDFGAMCDQAYGIRMDEHLYNRGAGPMEIELVNLKDRERLGGLTSIQLAATYKNPGDIRPRSYIDETGDFRVVNYKEAKARDEATLNSLVEANPMMSVADLKEATGITPYKIKETLGRFGWHIAKGGANGHSPWHKDNGQPCPFKPQKQAVDLNKRKPVRPPTPGIKEAVDFLKKQSIDFPSLEAEVLQAADRLGISDSMLRKGMKRLGAVVKNGMVLIPEPEINPEMSPAIN